MQTLTGWKVAGRDILLTIWDFFNDDAWVGALIWFALGYLVGILN
jgi:hypothetical protein